MTGEKRVLTEIADILFTESNLLWVGGFLVLLLVEAIMLSVIKKQGKKKEKDTKATRKYVHITFCVIDIVYVALFIWSIARVMF